MADITLTPDQATAVITEAQQDKVGDGAVYAGKMPESPDKRVEVANELVGFAIDAYVGDNMRGIEVTDILNAAHVKIADDGTVSQNGAGTAPVTAEEPKAKDENPTAAAADPAQPEATEVTLVGPDGNELSVPEAAAPALEAAGWSRKQDPEPEPEPESTPEELVVEIGGQKVTLPYETAIQMIAAGTAQAVEGEEPVTDEAGNTPLPPADDDPLPAGEPTPVGDEDDPYAGQQLEEPWTGYDSEKDVDIRAKMQDFTEEEITYVKAYEARNKNRQRIANFKPGKKKAPAQTQEPSAADPAHDALDDQAQAAAEADTAGEDALPDDPEAKIPDGEFIQGAITDGPIESDIDPDHVPILTAQQERLIALAEVEKSRLPIPNDVIGDTPEFPEDVAGVDEGTLKTLHSQFNACLALANWKLGLVTVDERAFKHIADAKAREVRATLDHTNPATGKPKGREALEREAEDHQEVQVWRDKQFQADIRAVPLRKLVEIYSSHVEVLSRQWTFRERELASSGGLPTRS
jgi:hypothetical protein